MGALQNNLAWQRMFSVLAAFILVVLAATCLYVARGVLIPLAVSVLVTFILSPVVSALQRRRVPRTAAVLGVAGVAAALLLATLGILGSQVVQLLAELPAYQENVAKRIAEVREKGDGTVLRNVQRFVHEVTRAAAGPQAAEQAAAEEQAVSVRIVEQAAVSSMAWWVQSLQPFAEPVVTAGLIAVLVIYLLIFREDMRSRVLVLIGRGHLTVTTKALDDAGRRISRYLLAQFVINVSFGMFIGLGLLIIGVPHAVLWGFAGALLRYVPYLGPWIASLLPIGMSLLVSDGWVQPLSVVGLFIVAELATNLVAEPWLYGHSIGVSQAALMVAILFWTWLWGAVGLMLAAPLTTCLVVLGKYVPALKFFDILLGDEEVLTPDVGLYQRLLARDEDEAFEIARKQSLGQSPVELCDRVLVPALVHARQDLHAGLLSEDDHHYVLSSVLSIAEQLDLAGLAEASRRAAAPEAEPVARQPLALLSCPAQDGSESAALELFRQVLDPRKFRLEQVSAKQLVSEVLDAVEQCRPAVVCIAALPAGGLAHTRHLCKRIRARFPDLRIVVARWAPGNALDNRDQWTGCGAQYLSTSFEETLRQLDELALFLRPADASPPVASEAAAA